MLHRVIEAEAVESTAVEIAYKYRLSALRDVRDQPTAAYEGLERGQAMGLLQGGELGVGGAEVGGAGT